MKNNILRDIPLEQRLRTAIQIHFIANGGGCVFMPLDENGNDIEEVVEKNRECLEEAEPLIEAVLREVGKWKKDGCP